MQDRSLHTLRPAAGNQTFTVLFAGDFFPGETITEPATPESVFKDVLPSLSGCELKVIQFETVAADAGEPIDKSGPNLKSAPSVIEIVKQAGFDVALLANNHTGDFGGGALLETAERLRAAGLRTVGGGATLREANAPLALAPAGVPVEIFNFAENEFGTADADKPGSAPLSPLANLAAVRRAAEAGSFVMVALHGGHEYYPYPTPRLTELCRAFADAGAKLVWNCHPHTPQGAEEYKGVPITYSPGNFYFPRIGGDRPLLWYVGYMVKYHCDSTGVFAYEIIPYSNRWGGVTPLAGELREGFFDYFERLSAPLADAAELRKLFEAWSTRAGASYLASSISAVPADWREHLADRDTVKAMLGLRNVFTCEAHNDLVRTYLRLIEEYRTEEAAALFPRIEAMQNPPELAEIAKLART